MSSVTLQISPGLVHEAQLGNKYSINRLTELVRERLFAYIYRLTLDEALTQDLLQETILYMLQSINQLEHTDHFWPWLYRTALGKIQHHYRDLKRKKNMELNEAERTRIHMRVTAEFNDGLSELLRKELSDAVFKAMKRLNLKYRNVLILRCFENLEYSQIASMLNCSELRSRVLFFRAKNSLRRQLAVQGFGQCYFLIALALFGFVTTSAKAASSTITAASLDVGFAAAFIAALSSKAGIAATAGLATLAFAVPLQIFLSVIALSCLAGILIFLVCLLGIYG
ncbi:MAG: sigma-70 family RNA polymerase sigma factor [Sedimentisphaerales bacterium]|nr:sigma-70 family RNA polymerase sigma factor [Sedimentisphaerales bacterium]